MPSPSSTSSRRGRRIRRTTSKGRANQKATSRRRARNRRSSIKSKKTRYASQMDPVADLTTRFGKIKGPKKALQVRKGPMDLVGLLDALPTANPFSRRLYAPSRSRSKSGSKAQRRAKTAKQRRRNYVRARRLGKKKSIFKPATFTL